MKSMHYQTQLELYSGPKKVLDNGYMICCPYHADKTPSMRIWLRSGYCQCYGCGTNCSFDDMAPLIGLEPYVRDPMKPVKAHSRSLITADSDAELYDKSYLKKCVLSPLPKHKKWRSVPTWLLQDIGCQVLTTEFGQDFIFLPNYIRRRLVGFVRGRLKKVEGSLSYINAKGRWVKTHGLFPYDYTMAMMKRMGTSTVVLVEGQRDALRLILNGIPALAIMGTNNWTDEKTLLLELGGVDRAIYMPDGDEAGKLSVLPIMESLQSNIEAALIRTWAIKGNPYPQYARLSKIEQKLRKDEFEFWDPGNCPLWVLNRIKRDYYGKR